MAKTELKFEDNGCLRLLVGELGANLKQIERFYSADIGQRGNTLFVQAESGSIILRVETAIQELYSLIQAGVPLGESDVRHCLNILRKDPDADLQAFFRDRVVTRANGQAVTPRTVGQRRYIAALRKSSIVFGVGPAGTGKTYLAVAAAIAELQAGTVKRIVLTRPAVEAGEKLGFLPGDLSEKVNPYLRPLYDALHDILSAERTERLLERGTIEVVPLAFMRGRTLEEAFVILDEGQNTTNEQMKMFLTRMGVRSRVVVTGDETQVDLPHAAVSGLTRAIEVLGHVKRIEICRFGSGDVVRHPLVAEIVDAYEASGEPRRGASRNRMER